jgi:hypothetical protein
LDNQFLSSHQGNGRSPSQRKLDLHGPIRKKPASDHEDKSHDGIDPLVKKSWKGKPWIHKGRTNHNEKGNDDPEKNSSQDDSHQSQGFTIFVLRPFFIPSIVAGLTEAFPLLSVSAWLSRWPLQHSF